MRLIDLGRLRTEICIACADGVIEIEDCDDCMLQKLIDEQPTIEAEPVRYGRWLLLPNQTSPSKIFRCSECGNITEHKHYSQNGYYSFCKDCGAKMMDYSVIEQNTSKAYIGSDTHDNESDLNATLWVSCKNELPEDGINVIVAWGNTVDESDTFVGVAMRMDSVWYWYPLSSNFLSAIDKDVEVTHWMPLPEKPEVKKDDV